MKKPLFIGACTALVTPFLNGHVNYPMLEQLLRRQLDAGIRAIVLSGTTGESPTLSDAEKISIFKRSKEYVGDKCLIIAGTGSNSTQHAIALSIAAENAGADAVLVVSPYYNKSTENGLIKHYTEIARHIQIPMIIYNVPSRTGLDIPVYVYSELSKIPNIAGVKEASSDVSKIAHIRKNCPDYFCIWSGNDALTVPIMALNGSGVISVMSNIFPKEVNAMTLAAYDGDFDTAAALQLELLPLNDALYSEVNPIPIKAALKILGYDCGNCRMPLTELSQEHYQQLEKLLSF